jgi:hypothetical protein
VGGGLLRERENGICNKEELGLLYHEEGGGGVRVIEEGEDW